MSILFLRLCYLIYRLDCALTDEVLFFIGNFEFSLHLTGSIRNRFLVGNGIEIGSKHFFMSETETESEPNISLGRKRNRNRKASISRNGIGNGI